LQKTIVEAREDEYPG